VKHWRYFIWRNGSMAPVLAIIGVVVGIALGLRFKVFVLVPAIALAVIFALTVGLARGDGFGSIVLAVVIVVTASTWLFRWNILGEAHAVAVLMVRSALSFAVFAGRFARLRIDEMY
jgi:hypothetical protein